MPIKLVFLLIITFLMPFLHVDEGNAAATSFSNSLQDLRFGIHPDKTRFVIDFKKIVSYRTKVLNKYQISLSLPHERWPRLLKKEGQGKGLVKSFKVKEGKGVEIILTLAKPIRLSKPFIMRSNNKGSFYLVVDLYPLKRDKFSEKPQVFNSSTGTPSQEERGNKPINGLIIALDAGHGGNDPGAQIKKGVYEKHITLSCAQYAKVALETAGYQVILTREKDETISLRERFAKARRAGAKLLISMHADAYQDPNTKGMAVYTLSETASSEEAQNLVDQENRHNVIQGVDLTDTSRDVSNILVTLAQRETQAAAARFADILINELKTTYHLPPHPHRFAGFAVLKAPDMPSILLELGYVSNKMDAKVLQTKAQQKKIAQLLKRSVDLYFATTPTTLQPRPAQVEGQHG